MITKYVFCLDALPGSQLSRCEYAGHDIQVDAIPGTPLVCAEWHVLNMQRLWTGAVRPWHQAGVVVRLYKATVN